MDSVIHQSVIQDGVLLDQHLNDFLWSDSTEEGWNGMNPAVRETKELVQVLFIKLFVRSDLWDDFICSGFNPLEFFGSAIFISLFRIIVVFSHASIVTVFFSELLDNADEDVPQINTLVIMQLPLEFFTWLEFIQFLFNATNMSHLQMVGILAKEG